MFWKYPQVKEVNFRNNPANVSESHIVRSMFMQQHSHTGENLKSTALKNSSAVCAHWSKIAYRRVTSTFPFVVANRLLQFWLTRGVQDKVTASVSFKWKNVLVARLTLQVYRKPIWQEVEEQDSQIKSIFPTHTRPARWTVYAYEHVEMHIFRHFGT